MSNYYLKKTLFKSQDDDEFINLCFVDSPGFSVRVWRDNSILKTVSSTPLILICFHDIRTKNGEEQRHIFLLLGKFPDVTGTHTLLL